MTAQFRAQDGVATCRLWSLTNNSVGALQHGQVQDSFRGRIRGYWCHANSGGAHMQAPARYGRGKTAIMERSAGTCLGNASAMSTEEFPVWHLKS
jgi:hypothetical protein